MNDLISIEVKNSVGTITDNLDKVEIAIKESLKDYQGMVVTEDVIQDSKKVLANIRKEQKTLDDERKAIKKAWMAPFEAFEKRAKHIIGLYDEPVKLIDGQLAEFEAQRRQEKKKVIEEIYSAVKLEKGEYLGGWVSLEHIYNPKWENATYSEKGIREDIERCFAQIEMSLSTIKAMESEFEQKGIDTLKKTGDLQAAIRVMQERKRIKEEIIAQEKAKQEADQRAKEEAEQRAAEEVKQELKQEFKQEFKQAQEEFPFELEKTVTFKVCVRYSFANDLEDFLMDNHIKYEVCDE